MSTEHVPAGPPPGPVLVAYDGRWQGDELITAAAHEAERRRRPLSIITLTGTPADLRAATPEGGQTARVSLTARTGDDFAHRFPDLPVTTHVLPYAEVPAGAELFRSAELLVLGARGMDGNLPFGPSSASARLLAATSCPVLALSEAAVRARHVGGGRRVVAALSGAASDAGVGEAAAFEAEQLNAEVQFVHSFAASRAEPLPRSVVRALDGIASALPARLPAESTVSLVLTEEAPAAALGRAAQGALVLVLGARAGSLRGDVLGSVSRAVLQSVDCPLLIIRSEDAMFRPWSIAAPSTGATSTAAAAR